jgi:two-component system, chemotaxis family, response regulator Rcp1
VSRKIEDCTILYVDDDDATVYLFRMALRQAGIAPRVLRVGRGDEAIAFLTRVAPFEEAPVPDMVILDLNLPVYSGFDILRQIQNHPPLRNIPAYVFSTSNDPRDRERAAALGVHGYLVKGESLDAFVDAAKTICSELTK